MLHDFQIDIGLGFAGRAIRQRFEKVVHRGTQSIDIHPVLRQQFINRRQRAHDFCAVDDSRGQASDIAFHLVSIWVVGNLVWIRDAQRAIRHVTNDIVGDIHDLSRFGAIDGIEVWIVL